MLKLPIQQDPVGPLRFQDLLVRAGLDQQPAFQDHGAVSPHHPFPHLGLVSVGDSTMNSLASDPPNLMFSATEAEKRTGSWGRKGTRVTGSADPGPGSGFGTWENRRGDGQKVNGRPSPGGCEEDAPSQGRGLGPVARPSLQRGLGKRRSRRASIHAWGRMRRTKRNHRRSQPITTRNRFPVALRRIRDAATAGVRGFSRPAPFSIQGGMDAISSL